MAATSRAGLVSGEAVVLDLGPASFASRGIALALDLLVMFMAVIALNFVASLLALGFDEAGQEAVQIVVSIAALIALPATLETLTRGRTLGKMAMGLRVVRDDGGPIRFRQAFVRVLLALVEVYTLPFLSLIATLSNPRGKRLGDLLAGTYVVRDRSDGHWAPAQMAPELTMWAARADVGHLPESLVAAARTFLTATMHLQPQARVALARSLADDLVGHVQPPPPPGTDPERFISSVLAERRRRDLLRLQDQARAAAARRWRRAGAGVLSPSSSQWVLPQPPPPRR